MSAISTTPAETESLVEAVDGYARANAELTYLQRASARMILDALDQHYPPSEDRTQVRQRVLDTLAYYAKEVERWASSLQAET